MEEKKEIKRGNNDILNEAAKEIRREPEARPASFDETIVFRREPTSNKTSSGANFRLGANSNRSTAHEDMGNTAQIRGGAVVRPLKKQPNQPPQERAPLQAYSQNKQPAPRPNGAAPVRPAAPQHQAPQQSQIQKQQQPRPTSSPQAQMPARNGTVVPPLRGTAPKDAVNQRTVNQSGAIQQNRINTVQGQNRPAQNNHAGAKRPAGSTPVPPALRPRARTDNDDFEIDEATYDRAEYRRRAGDGKNGKNISQASDSATSAVMSLVKAVIYIVAVIAVSIGLSVFVINTANDVFKFVVDDKVVSVTIPDNATIDDVADALHDSGAIKYKWAFKVWSNMKDSDPEFIPGTYEVSTTLNYDYLRASFKKSTSREVVRITIPEGYTVDEIINLFVKNGIGTKEGFIDAINNHEFTGYRFIDELTPTEGRFYRLEGYLFPDTYDFYKDSSEVAVITKLLNNFNRKFVSEYYDRAAYLGMTVDEAITLASMIEKEARYADDLGGVSSVFHNRLKYSASFPYLNCDATIMYAIAHDTGARLETMTSKDTEYNSIYNTYTHKGLPPSAISNPGLNAIKYALYPNSTDYFYFVSDASGRMLYAKTEAQHLVNINTVRGK